MALGRPSLPPPGRPPPGIDVPPLMPGSACIALPRMPPAPDLRIAFGWRLSLPLPLSLRRLAGISPPSGSPELLIAPAREGHAGAIPCAQLSSRPPTIALVPYGEGAGQREIHRFRRCGARRSTLTLANHRNKVFRSIPANL